MIRTETVRIPVPGSVIRIDRGVEGPTCSNGWLKTISGEVASPHRDIPTTTI